MILWILQLLNFSSEVSMRATCCIRQTPTLSAVCRYRAQLTAPVRDRNRRQCWARATGDADSERAQAKVMKQVQASARVIEEMMKEISEELFINAAVTRITDSEEGSPAAVVGAAVEACLEQLDETFLATLDSYIQGAAEKGAGEVAEVLLMVREAVLQRLGQRLPVEMRLLDRALSAADSKARMAVLKQYALLSEAELAAMQPAGSSSGGEDAPSGSGDAAAEEGRGGDADLYCLAADVERAASQVINDMEGMVEVPDRKLLARLVLVREELQQLLLETAFKEGEGSAEAQAAAAFRQPFQELQAVPRSCAAFLQRVMGLQGEQERRALLRHAFSKDVERAPNAREPGPDATRRERLRAEAERPQEWVRPGRFMQSLAAMQAEMLGRASAPSEGEVVPSDAVLERVESVRRDALAALLELAGEDLGDEEPYLP